MPRTNVEALLIHQPKRSFSQPAKQPPPEASAPAKKPRTGHQAARAPKKGQRPARRAPAAALGSEGGASEGDPGDDEPAPLTEAHDRAYAHVRAEIVALPRDEVRRITVHVPAAAMLALGALPRMRAFREAMIAELVNPPLEALDKLHDYALAAARAHAYLVLRDDGENTLRALLDEAVPLRERLLLGAELLAAVGLLDAKKVAIIRQGSGRLDTAQDLSALAALFLGAWPAVASKIPFSRADVERAAELGDRLIEALGRQKQRTDGSGEPGELEEQLGKAYELFRRAYQLCRRAITFLRFDEGDADEIAPPLGQSRRRGRRSEVDEPEGDEPNAPEPTPTEPSPVDPGDGEIDVG
jgi:hypothetical protein